MSFSERAPRAFGPPAWDGRVDIVDPRDARHERLRRAARGEHERALNPAASAGHDGCPPDQDLRHYWSSADSTLRPFSPRVAVAFLYVCPSGQARGPVSPVSLVLVWTWRIFSLLDEYLWAETASQAIAVTLPAAEASITRPFQRNVRSIRDALRWRVGLTYVLCATVRMSTSARTQLSPWQVSVCRRRV
jgi:hypothetical protein